MSKTVIYRLYQGFISEKSLISETITRCFLPNLFFFIKQHDNRSKIVIYGLYQWFISEKSLISKIITRCFWFLSLIFYQAPRWRVKISLFVSLSAVYHFFTGFFTDNTLISKILSQSDFFKLVNFDLLYLITASYQ